MISIVDNFFSDEDLNIFQKKIDDVKYTNSDETTGWQGMRSDNLNETEPLLSKILTSTIESKFSVNINLYKKIEFGFHYRKDTKVNIHTDESEQNCLIFLKGDLNIWNGTGFYIQKNATEQVLSTTVGFKENRAIFFNGNLLHASLTGLNQSLSTPRRTLNTFLYEF